MPIFDIGAAYDWLSGLVSRNQKTENVIVAKQKKKKYKTRTMYFRGYHIKIRAETRLWRKKHKGYCKIERMVKDVIKYMDARYCAVDRQTIVDYLPSQITIVDVRIYY